MQAGVQDKSFRAAATHLFRHINDPSELRRNSLASAFFDKHSDVAGKAALHKQILRLAAEFALENPPLSSKYQLERFKTIIEGICFGEPAPEIAKKLGLSLRQYYRERQLACARIARALLKASAKTNVFLESGDPLDLLFRRARLLVEQGFASHATSLLEGELRTTAGSLQREAIYLHLCRTLVLYGDVDRARQTLGVAELFRGSERRPDQLSVLRLLAQVDVAIATGQTAEAERLLADSRQLVPPSQQFGSQELLVELLLERSNHCSLYGKYQESIETLELLLTMVRKVSRIPAYLEVLMATQVARCMEYQAEVPEQCLSKWDEVLTLAESVGSARGCYYALKGLVRYYLLIGSEEPAYACFKHMCQIVRSMEGPRPTVAAGLTATYLLNTRFWRETGAILNEAHELPYPTSASAAKLRSAEGQYLARLGKLNEAQQVIASAIEIAKAITNQPLLAALLREYSLVLYRLGHRRKAKQCIKEAVFLSEEVSDALSRKETYRVATGILLDNLDLKPELHQGTPS